jgi:hypothetical protein
MVPNDRYIFMYFEEQGIDIPVINKARMCRQGNWNIHLLLFYHCYNGCRY